MLIVMILTLISFISLFAAATYGLIFLTAVAATIFGFLLCLIVMYV